MHQHFLKICGLFLVALGLGYGQMFAQNPDWPLVPNLQHFSSSGNTPSVMTGSYPTPYYASNSAQDASGNLMFYVVNEQIYDSNGTLIGSCGGLLWSSNGKDILIVPDPNDCEARLILSGHLDVIVGQSVVYDCFLNATRVRKTGSSWVVQPNYFSYTISGNDNSYMSMALSQPDNNGQRNWYVVTSKYAYQFKVGSNGINYASQYFLGNAGQPIDAEVSPSGDKLIWAETDNHGELLWLNLNVSTGAFLSTFVSSRPITPMGWYRVYGLEFVNNNTFLVSGVRVSPTGPSSGIFLCTGFTIELAPSIYPNAAYATSQLEKALDGKIYAASANGLIGIDPTNTSITVAIPGAVKSNDGNPFYTLPKQLDYENYAQVFGCPCPQNVTITGSYATPLTESQTWIKSNGVCTIPAGTTVKLDADPSSGYVELNPGFLADWRTGGSVFIAQAFNGCTAGAPLRPSPLERSADLDARPAEEARGQSATIFPNPTNGDFTLEFNEALPSETLVVVLDLTGRTVFQALVPEGTLRQTCSLGNAPSGMYVVRALCEGKPVWTGKVLKEE